MIGRALPTIFVCLVVAGCGTSSSSRTTSSTGVSQAGSGSAKSNPALSNDGITGFGASLSAWNASHTRDPKYSGLVYNPDPSSPSGDDYDAVITGNGRVLGYDMRFANEPISEARAKVAAEFPSDTKVLAFRVKGAVCAFELVSSAKLGHVLGTNAIGDSTGAALIEYGSGASDSTYDPNSVNEALFSLDATTPSQIPAC